jgi:hypothetical protein
MIGIYLSEHSLTHDSRFLENVFFYPGSLCPKSTALLQMGTIPTPLAGAFSGPITQKRKVLASPASIVNQIYELVDLVDKIQGH